MWKEHVALTTSFPQASLPPSGAEAAMDPVTVRRKRLVYRSKQRGWLEVDLLLGTWAQKNVPTLTVAEMDSYEDILNLETLDIFSFISGNADPPAFVDTAMMKRLRDTDDWMVSCRAHALSDDTLLENMASGLRRLGRLHRPRSHPFLWSAAEVQGGFVEGVRHVQPPGPVARELRLGKAPQQPYVTESKPRLIVGADCFVIFGRFVLRWAALI
ncbi:unnamed protein product [Ascophyllum nodosum]